MQDYFWEWWLSVHPWCIHKDVLWGHHSIWVRHTDEIHHKMHKTSHKRILHEKYVNDSRWAILKKEQNFVDDSSDAKSWIMEHAYTEQSFLVAIRGKMTSTGHLSCACCILQHQVTGQHNIQHATSCWHVIKIFSNVMLWQNNILQKICTMSFT